ncbi:transposable element Tcb1 transposase [Trichonephila clavipes]|nr:transposable element Tcb1 transposase [Trichonephila clavipes]
MDDNARPHRADIVDDYLESEGIARMAWPAYSPDLNPIENLWDALDRAVSSRFPPPTTLIELETALKEEWRLLNSAVVDHLIESMNVALFPERLVISALEHGRMQEMLVAGVTEEQTLKDEEPRVSLTKSFPTWHIQ